MYGSCIARLLVTQCTKLLKFKENIQCSAQIVVKLYDAEGIRAFIPTTYSSVSVISSQKWIYGFRLSVGFSIA